MLVIQGTLSQAERRTLFDDNNLIGDVTAIFPADRCIWEVPTYDGDNYTLGAASVVAADREFLIANAQLGFIGKTGRFVGFTV